MDSILCTTDGYAKYMKTLLLTFCDLIFFISFQDTA